jgi:hypothetical protein
VLIGMIDVDASEQELFDSMSTDNILITFERFLNSLAGKHHHVIYTTGSVTLRLCDLMSKDSHTKLMIRIRGNTKNLYENKGVTFSEGGYRYRTLCITNAFSPSVGYSSSASASSASAMTSSEGGNGGGNLLVSSLSSLSSHNLYPIPEVQDATPYSKKWISTLVRENRQIVSGIETIITAISEQPTRDPSRKNQLEQQMKDAVCELINPGIVEETFQQSEESDMNTRVVDSISESLKNLSLSVLDRGGTRIIREQDAFNIILVAAADKFTVAELMFRLKVNRRQAKRAVHQQKLLHSKRLSTPDNATIDAEHENEDLLDMKKESHARVADIYLRAPVRSDRCDKNELLVAYHFWHSELCTRLDTFSSRRVISIFEGEVMGEHATRVQTEPVTILYDLFVQSPQYRDYCNQQTSKY